MRMHDTYIDLLRFKAFLEVILLAFQARDELVKFFGFLCQSGLIETVDTQWNDPLLQDCLLLRFQLFFRFLLLSFLQQQKIKRALFTKMKYDMKCIIVLCRITVLQARMGT